MHGILRHSMLNVASMIVSTGAGLVVTVIVARLLGPSGSGLVAFALWAAISLCALTDRGIPQTVLRYAAAAGTEEERRELVGSAFRRFLRLPLLAFALGCAGAIMLAADLLPVDRELLLAGAMAFMLYALASFSISASRGRGEFLVPAVNIIAGSLLQIPLVVIGAWFAGAAGALAAIATRFLPQTLHLFRILDRRSLAPDKPPEADMRAYGRAMWISDVVNIVVLGRVEYLVLAVFLSSTDLGLFAVAEVIKNLVNPEERALIQDKVTNLWPSREDFRRATPATVRGTSLGLVLGMLPGGGAMLSSFAAYALEKRISKQPRNSDTAPSREWLPRKPPTMPARRPPSSRC